MLVDNTIILHAHMLIQYCLYMLMEALQCLLVACYYNVYWLYAITMSTGRKLCVELLVEDTTCCIESEDATLLCLCVGVRH